MFKGKNVTAYPNGKKAESNDLKHRIVAYAVKKVSKNINVYASVAIMGASFSTTAAVTMATGGNIVLGRAAGVAVGSIVCGKIIKHFSKNKKVTAYANGTKVEKNQLSHSSLKEKIEQNAKDFEVGFKTIAIGYTVGLAAGTFVGAATGNPVAAYATGMSVGVSINRYLLSKRNKKNR